MITPYCAVIIRLSSSMVGHLRETNNIFRSFFNECHQYHVAFTLAQMGSQFYINNLRSRFQSDSPPDACSLLDPDCQIKSNFRVGLRRRKSCCLICFGLTMMGLMKTSL